MRRNRQRASIDLGDCGAIQKGHRPSVFDSAAIESRANAVISDSAAIAKVTPGSIFDCGAIRFGRATS
jgi:hypothetical protein